MLRSFPFFLLFFSNKDYSITNWADLHVYGYRSSDRKNYRFIKLLIIISWRANGRTIKSFNFNFNFTKFIPGLWSDTYRVFIDS